MATLTNTKIKDTYDGLLKTTDNQAIDASGVTLIEDGLGNASALSVGRSGNGVTITGSLNATLATAAQPNITSVGTLSSLAVSGNLTVDTNTLFVDAANNRVGVGELSPSRSIHISAATPAIRLEDTTGNDYSEIVSVDGDLFIRADEGATQADSSIRFQIDQSEKVRIDDSGNVGIGVTPTSVTHGPHLEVGNLRGTVSAGTGYFEDNGGTNFLNGARPLAFGVAGSERMRIDASGNVVIGATATAAKFEVHTGAIGRIAQFSGDSSRDMIFQDESGFMSIDTRNTSTGLAFQIQGSEKVRITSNGLTFNGDTAAANALDDYEEGTFTLTVTSSGYTISSQSASYTKIGRQVTINGQVTFNAVNASSNSLANFTGVPFTASGQHIGSAIDATTTGASYVARVSGGTLILNSMDGISTGSQRTLRINEDYVFSVTYFV